MPAAMPRRRPVRLGRTSSKAKPPTRSSWDESGSSRRAPRTARLPGGVPPTPRPERRTGLALPTSPPHAATRIAAAGARPGHAPGGGLPLHPAAAGGTRLTPGTGGRRPVRGAPGRVPAAGCKRPAIPSASRGSRGGGAGATELRWSRAPAPRSLDPPRLRRFQPDTDEATTTCAPPTACNGRRGVAPLRGCMREKRGREPNVDAAAVPSPLGRPTTAGGRRRASPSQQSIRLPSPFAAPAVAAVRR
jgi:hypothetical protein